MTTPSRRPSSRTDTPSSSVSHLDLLSTGAPLKQDGGIGLSDGEDSPIAVSKRVTSATLPNESPESDLKRSIHAYSPKRSSSLSLAFTPIGPTQLESTSVGPTPAQERSFESKMQASNSKARSYVAPHRRPPVLELSPSYPSLESYDQSCLPESEDAYHSPLQRLEIPPHLRKRASGSESEDEALYSPLPTIISRGPYVEPDKFSHPAAIEEEEEEEEGIVLGRRTLDRASMALPSPVIEEDETHGTASGEDEIGSSENDNDDGVCSSCGCAPVASFVALIPCDHLLCHTCLNALINGCAHKPPREMTCFMCSSPIASFGPAWENTASLGLVDALLTSLRNGDSVRHSDLPSKKKGKENAFPASPIGISTQANSSASHTRNSSVSTNTSFGNLLSPMRAVSTPLRKGTGESRWAAGIEVVGETSVELSPYRELDWSLEGPLSPEEARNKAWEAIGKNVDPLEQPQEVIDKKTAWPVVRLDNIPWDVTAAEIEDWLPEGSLAPVDECVLAVHILCNRSDGRTLSQAYIEVSSLEAARMIVRSRDGRKIGGRPVHVTLSNQTILMTTIFPSWEPGFQGLNALPGAVPGPLLMQTELTGLVSLCKLESNHASKVKERPYYNIVTILEKFPWHQPETYNSKQIVRLFNTSCAAVEILGAVRGCVPDWVEILTTMVDAVAACPVFLPKQKNKFVRISGLQHTRYPSGNSPKRNLLDSGFSFSPPSLRDKYVSVAFGPTHSDDESPSKILDLAPHRELETTPIRAARQQYELSPTRAPSLESNASRLSKTTSAPNLLFPSSSSIKVKVQPPRSPKKVVRRRRAESISRQLGVDDEVVRAVAEQLGVVLEKRV